MSVKGLARHDPLHDDLLHGARTPKALVRPIVYPWKSANYPPMIPALVFLTLLLWLIWPRAHAFADVEPSEIDDDILVRQAQSGDRQAFNRLVGRHQSLMYNIAFRVMGDADRAADATQDAFVSAYKKLGQYSGGNFRAWMARIVKNQCYDLLRYENRRPATSLDALLLPQQAEASSTLEGDDPLQPEEATLQQEVAEWLQQIILHLPIDQRMTLVMADVHGYSYEEIAEVTDVELGTVKSRLARARRKVRELLQQNPELLPAQYRL